jgi:Asp-tRNA(Asn)/Glu-tRNA(Gln) amidotransferase A subunit family amidase
MAEVAEVHGELFAEHAAMYGANVAEKVRRCLALDESEARAARARRELYRERLAPLWEQIDLLITPTLPCVAPPNDVDELALRERFIRFTIPFNITGAPALAIPCAAAEDGLPASVQLVGAPGADALVLAAGGLLEAAVGATARG